MTTRDRHVGLRFFLGGDRYVLGDNGTAIYLFKRDQLDQPLQEWPDTLDGRIAAKVRLRELDEHIVALPAARSLAAVPRRPLTRDQDNVAEAEIIFDHGCGYGTVMGCPTCSTIYWLGANEWREICTQCGAAGLLDADVLLVQREATLERELIPALESLTGKWRAEARGRRLVAKERPRILFGGITPGPLYLYLREQYHATFRYGRRLAHDEAHERIDALCAQQAAAIEAQRRSQYELAAVVAFLSVSNQLRTIERNQHQGL